MSKQDNNKYTGKYGSLSKPQENNEEGNGRTEGNQLGQGKNSNKETMAEPMELSHTCPFPKCNDLVLINDEAYYNHLWQMHKLGRNK